MTNTNKLRNLNGVAEKLSLKVKPWANYSKEEKAKLISEVKPTQKNAVVTAVQLPGEGIGQIRKNTKRDYLISLGLKGAFAEEFLAFASTGFWKGAFQDDAGGWGWVEETQEIEGKKRKFFQYIAPNGVEKIAYTEKPKILQGLCPEKKVVKKATAGKVAKKAVKKTAFGAGVQPNYA